MLRELCRQHTGLREQDIRKLERFAETLPSFSELLGVDLFMDCLVDGGDRAVVVCEQKPVNNGSILSRSVIGEVVDKTTEPGVLRTLRTGLMTKDLKAVTVEQRAMTQTVAPIRNEAGQVIGVLVSETAVPEEALRLEALENQTRSLTKTVDALGEHLWMLIQHLDDAILIFDRRRQVVHMNQEAREFYRKLGYMEELHGMHLRNLVLSREIYEELKETESNICREVHYGSCILEIQCIFLHHKEEPQMVMIVRDMSEIRARDRELILKSVAMQEIHHRVKNNLQTIAGILLLQANRHSDERVKSALNENVSRVLSIATTHEILARQGMDDLEINTLLEKIRDNILCHCLPDVKRITVTVEGDRFLVASDVATAVALVVNELLSNALEHAFKGQESGNVQVRITSGSPMAGISIVDDGCGYNPASLRDGSLGLRIVRALVTDKLGGRLEITSTGTGTRAEFTFQN